MKAPVLLWFRQDLRLADNPALEAVADRPVLPVFVLDDAAAGRWAYGGAMRWWLRGALDALGADLTRLGAPLLVRRGEAATIIPALASAIGASEVLANVMTEPWARRRDAAIADALERDGRALALFEGALLHHPDRIRSGGGTPYSVFTPFSRAVEALGEPVPEATRPARLERAAGEFPCDPLDLYPVRGEPDWAREFGDHWTPGEAGASARLDAFVRERLGGYKTARNDPGIEGSSGLSPHLRWGEISPRQVWRAVRDAAAGDRERAWPFLSEIVWREFSHHLLWHRPELPEQALRQRFAAFPFEPDAELLHAWQRGETGYPIVDAGMRQLWRIGWMHNRVRMIAASLLVKHLLQPWQLGAGYFWDTLVDGDLASNSASWQWIAGSGTDAAPYFRVFNPVLQGQKFDPTGRYVRRWVPELAALPDASIHQPWKASAGVLREAGVTLGSTYPRPIVEHERGRARALAALAAMSAAAA